MTAPELTQPTPPSAELRAHVRILVWLGLLMTLCALVSAGYLLYCMLRWYSRIARPDYDSSMYMIGLQSVLYPGKYSIAGTVAACVAVICAMCAFRGARRSYARVALCEITLSGIAFLLILFVYWGTWCPFVFFGPAP